MNTFSIIADSPQEAIEKARESFGPEAIIQEVRKQPRQGISRIWKQPRLELIIGVPSRQPSETDSIGESTTPSFFDVYKKQHLSEGSAQDKSPEGSCDIPSDSREPSRIEPMLRKMGLGDYWVNQLLDRLAIRFKDGLPDFVTDELAFCRSLLTEQLKEPQSDPREANHPILLMGSPGCGKTTLLCKWMAHQVFQQQRNPEVWQLDGNYPNTAESLVLYAEMLGASILRYPRNDGPELPNTPVLIDMPGVAIDDQLQLDAYSKRLEELPDHDRYLVLNACYANRLLENQIKAFMPMNPKGIILTHLDEERSWGRLANLLLGTNCPAVLLSGGQKIPGTFELFRSSRFMSNVMPS